MTDLAGKLRRWRLRDTAEAEPTDRSARHPLLHTLLAARGLHAPADADRFLQPTLRDLADPTNVPGLTRASQRILEAVAAHQPIVVYGDYDVDGVTASAILYHTLRAVGGDVTCYVPHRLEEGYGLNSDALRQLAEHKPLIVTVDCGITAVEPARVARDCGVDLIITDHHQFDPENLPEAYALVHPELEQVSDCAPCGAGVAFKLAWQVMRQHCGSDKLPAELRDLLMDLLALAALGTVADVVPLREENRLITIFGLQRIKDTRFVGLNALIDAARLRDELIDSYHVGFVLGPRLNACGRMGHAREAVKLLTDATPQEAARLAADLTKENDRRRATERAIFEQAKQMVTEAGYDRDDCRALVLASAEWHPGVVGIVASRLVEAFGRPTVLLCVNGDNTAKGSARSVDGVCIHTALTACAEHILQFGGHAMAAGLTVPTPNIDALRDALVAHVNSRLTVDELIPQVTIDAEVMLGDCDLTTWGQIYKLAPFGRSNPEPRLLLRNVTLDRPAQRMGNGGKHLSLWLRQDDARARAVAFGFGDYADELPGGAVVDLVFSPKINAWNGRRTAELHVIDFRPAQQPACVD